MKTNPKLTRPELKIVVSNTPEAPAVEPVPEQVEMPFAIVNGEPVTQMPKDLYIPPQAMEVFLEAFEGPLDLLLYLIRRQNLNILDIPLAEITRQYMQYIEVMTELQLELAGEYMVMAATLAEIKSRMLLPRPKVDPEGNEEDPRAELVRRLQEYERFKRAAESIDALPRLERDVWTTSAELKDRKVVRLLPTVTLQEMLIAFKDVVVRSEMFAHHHIQRERLSVRERMGDILTTLEHASFVEFVRLFRLEEGRMGVTVTFMALLELVREGLIEIVQAEAFAPIHVRAAGASRKLHVVGGNDALGGEGALAANETADGAAGALGAAASLDASAAAGALAGGSAVVAEAVVGDAPPVRVVVPAVDEDLARFAEPALDPNFVDDSDDDLDDGLLEGVDDVVDLVAPEAPEAPDAPEALEGRESGLPDDGMSPAAMPATDLAATDLADTGLAAPATDLADTGLAAPATDLADTGLAAPATDLADTSLAASASDLADTGLAAPATDLADTSLAASASDLADTGLAAPATDLADTGVAAPATDLADTSLAASASDLADTGLAAPATDLADTGLAAPGPAETHLVAEAPADTGLPATALVEGGQPESGPVEFESGLVATGLPDAHSAEGAASASVGVAVDVGAAVDVGEAAHVGEAADVVAVPSASAIVEAFAVVEPLLVPDEGTHAIGSAAALDELAATVEFTPVELAQPPVAAATVVVVDMVPLSEVVQGEPSASAEVAVGAARAPVVVDDLASVDATPPVSDVEFVPAGLDEPGASDRIVIVEAPELSSAAIAPSAADEPPPSDIEAVVPAEDVASGGQAPSHEKISLVGEMPVAGNVSLIGDESVSGGPAVEVEEFASNELPAVDKTGLANQQPAAGAQTVVNENAGTDEPPSPGEESDD